MTYTKPEVEVLGRATVLIEASSPKGTSNVDGPSLGNPAYDLDE